MQRLLTTNESTQLLVQRAVLALVIWPHGAQKLLGWYGGFGFEASMNFLTGPEHVPSMLALLVVLGESLGALLLAFGLFTRVAAFGISAIMLGAVYLVHWTNGFFMNWFGNQSGEGFEFHLLALALSLPLMWRGGGRYAADTRVLRWLKAPRAQQQTQPA
ncbi:MAG: DoxX family protein [Myxococcales bacterium]